MSHDEFRMDRREFAGAAGLLLAGGGATGPETTTVKQDPEPAWTESVGDGASLRVVDVRDGLVFVEIGSAGALAALSAASGKERWRFTRGDGIPSLLETGDGVVFTYADGVLYAVDTADGGERWHAETELSQVTVADGTVYVGNRDGVWAYDAGDGSRRWRSSKFDVADIRVHDGTVYAGGPGMAFALAADDGTQRWVFNVDGEHTLAFDGSFQRTVGLQWTTGTVADGTVLLQTRGSGPLFAVSDDGEERWRFGDGEELQYGVLDGMVYAADRTTVHALAPADGSERWSASPGSGADLGRLSLAGGHLLVEQSDALHRLSLDDGERLWTTRTEDGVLSEAGAEVIAAGSATGRHAAISPEDGSKFWEYTPEARVTWYPQVADATVFMGTDDGRVHAIDVSVSHSLLETATERVGPFPLAFGGTLLAGALVAGGYRLLNRSEGERERPAAPVPTDLDAFEVETELAGDDERGTAAGVAVASWPGSKDRRVALKRFPADVDGFASAMETWTALDEMSGIVPVHEWGREPIPWIAMAYAEGGSLAGALPTLTTVAGLRVVADASEAVHAAHREGVVHGNLHADTVLLTGDDPAAMVGGWGFPRTRSSGPTVAPEVRDGGDADARSDVFSLGALAYRVATGRYPYPDGFEEASTPPGEIDSGIDPALSDAILRALAVDPADRYPTVLAFRDRLRWAAFVR